MLFNFILSPSNYPRECVSIERSNLQIAYSFLVTKDLLHAGRELQQVKLFPVWTVGGH